MRFVAVVACLTACSFGRGDGDPPGDDTVAPDAPATPGCASFSTLFDTCDLAPPGDLMLAGSASFNTSSGRLIANGAVVDATSTTVTTAAGEIEVILAGDVTIAPGTVLRATGPRPFGIVAAGTITLGAMATLDVGRGGAGTRSDCAGPPSGGIGGGGGGGGGGGAFGAAGGAGGAGATALGGSGGQPQTPLGLLGGCAGAPGGAGALDAGGPGGAGGGAIYLAAGAGILIEATATIYAGGAGGQGGRQSGASSGDAGGGGGGSGGMIFLESPSVTVHGALAANGGGGGEGSGAASAGNNGMSGSFDVGRAAGGHGKSSGGGDGGLGGSMTVPAGDAVVTVASGGGGGGGGGAGVVWIAGPMRTLDGTITPMATPK